MAADNIFECIFMNEKFCSLIQISMQFVPEGLIDNRSVLVQVIGFGDYTDLLWWK